ncbi:hypothetical protein AB0J57_06745 [Streptomyces sp. NPDC049837]|uniref:hypothetical protein n=1 Tax=Streptomyces sp. NPDC049837 TaxID=3155277 RepID=UPI00343D5884
MHHRRLRDRGHLRLSRRARLAQEPHGTTGRLRARGADIAHQREKGPIMPGTVELTDLDALIDDLDERITDSELPTVEAYTEGCSGLCTIVICGTVVIC